VFTWVSEAFGFNLDEFVVVEVVTSLKETNLLSNKLKIHPNPANSIVYVETLSENISVYDISGRHIDISITKTAFGHQLNVANLNAGSYFIRDENLVGKFVKE
jgi:hypothetical protein